MWSGDGTKTMPEPPSQTSYCPGPRLARHCYSRMLVQPSQALYDSWISAQLIPSTIHHRPGRHYLQFINQKITNAVGQLFSSIRVAQPIDLLSSHPQKHRSACTSVDLPFLNTHINDTDQLSDSISHSLHTNPSLCVYPHHPRSFMPCFILDLAFMSWTVLPLGTKA